MFPYHVKLSDGTTTYELAVLQNPETHELAWREEELPFLIPRQGIGDASYANRDPEVEQVYVWEDWSLGHGKKHEREPGHYYISDGVDARFPHRLTPAPKLLDLKGFLITNQSAYLTTPDPWSNVGGATHTRGTGSSSGSGTLWSMTTTAAADYITVSVALNASTTSYRGKVVTARAEVGRGATSVNNVYLQLYDGIGTTDSPAVSNNDTDVSFTRTLDAAATEITLRFRCVGAVTSAYVASLDLFVGDNQTRSMVEFSGALYAAVGQVVGKWDATNNRFILQLVGATNCTSLAAHNGTLYAAFGSSTAYQYSTDGATWTVSTRGGNLQVADYFVSLGGSAAKTLWRALTPNTVSSTDNAANGATAWTDYTVGGTDRNITGLFAYQNSPVVGRADGLWVWDGVNSDFDDLTPEFKLQPSTSNFTAGAAWHGWFYTVTAQGAVLRYRQEGSTSFIEDVTSRLLGSSDGFFTGLVKAFAPSDAFLYLAVLTPLGMGGGGLSLTMLVSVQDDLTAHTLRFARAMQQVFYATIFSNSLYVLGTWTGDYNSTAMSVMSLPTTTINPSLETSPNLQFSPFSETTSGSTTATFDLSWFDGNFPGETKTLLSWELFGQNIDANNYFHLAYMPAGGTYSSSFVLLTNPFNNMTNGSQILTAKNNISAAANRSSKDWQFRLFCVYDGSGAPPVCEKLILRYLLRYLNTARAFYFSLDLESPALVMPDGSLNNITPRVVYEQLRTWEDTAWPVTLTISDAVTSYDVILRPVSLRTLYLGADGASERLIVDVVAKEVNT